MGLGLIGRERLQAATANRLTVVGGVDAQATPATLDNRIELVPTVDELLEREPDLVTVAVPHDVAGGIAIQCLRAGANVLVEKPLGRNLDEAEAIVAAQQRPGQLTVGFNYRFFAGVRNLIEDVQSGSFGVVTRVAIALGHGGSPGDEKTWKLDGQRAGGGCLIDPGVHALDLMLLLLGPDLDPLSLATWSGFWGTGIEEEARATLITPEGTLGALDISIVRWRSEFRIEVHGTEGYGVVTGRGRSYGPQEYRRGRRWGWRDTGRSQAETEEIVCTDDCAKSFVDELRDVVDGTGRACSGAQGLAVMSLLERMRSVGEPGAHRRERRHIG